MEKMKHKRLEDAYRFPGFYPKPWVGGIFGDPKARVIRLTRRSKKQFAGCAVENNLVGTIVSCGERVIFLVATPASLWSLRFDGFTVATAML